MKLMAVYTETHRIFKDEFFLPSLQDDYDLDIRFCEEGGGAFFEASWSKSISFKTETVINVVKENWGDVFVFSDVDIQFFQPTRKALLASIADYDIVCQRDDPNGFLCAGFWVAKANKPVLKLWEKVYEQEKEEKREQLAFNRYLRMKRREKMMYFLSDFIRPCRYDTCPTRSTGEGPSRANTGNRAWICPCPRASSCIMRITWKALIKRSLS